MKKYFSSFIFPKLISIIFFNVSQTDNIYHNCFRFYDPKLSQMTRPDEITPDPSNPLAYNRYAYVFNNPLKYIDPSGHTPEGVQDDGWQATNAFFVEHPAVNREQAQINQSKIRQMRKHLNIALGGVGEVAFERSDLRGIGGGPTGEPNFVRLYMRQNKNHKDTLQQGIFEAFQIAFNEAITYLDPGPIEVVPGTVLDETPLKKEWSPYQAYARKIDAYTNESRHLEYGSYYIYQPRQAPYIAPVGRNGSKILFSPAVLMAHEVFHVSLDKATLNGLFHAARVVEQNTIFPLHTLSDFAVLRKPNHFYAGNHPKSVQEDLKIGVDPVIDFENLVRMSLGYRSREYYRSDTSKIFTDYMQDWIFPSVLENY